MYENGGIENGSGGISENNKKNSINIKASSGNQAGISVIKRRNQRNKAKSASAAKAA